jgi:hypothetical protein
MKMHSFTRQQTAVALMAAVGELIAAGDLAFAHPTITAQPQDQTNYVGTTATFIVVASGTAPVTYQWQKVVAGFTNLTDATNAILTLANVQTNDDADYRAVVTDATGTTNTVSVHLTVALLEKLFISNPAPGKVTLSWQGSMVLFEVRIPSSGSLDSASLFRVCGTSPVTLPVGPGAHFFALRPPPTLADLQAAFQINLDRCRQSQVEYCEECVADFLRMSAFGPLTPDPAAGEACSIGVELGSSFCSAVQDILVALSYGIQPQPWDGCP